jgi:hypothetical protein
MFITKKNQKKQKIKIKKIKTPTSAVVEPGVFKVSI